MAITRDQYNKSLPLNSGVAVGTYFKNYKSVDKSIGVKKYGAERQWDNHLSNKSLKIKED